MGTHLHIAHRGYRTGLGDNTIAQIQEAIRLGADMVEVDVRRRRSDGELVLSHDKGPNETAPRLRDALALARQAPRTSHSTLTSSRTTWPNSSCASCARPT